MWNFHGSWFLILESPGDQGVSLNFAEFPGLIFSGISKGKVTSLKIPGSFFQKSISSTTPVWIFPGITQFHNIVYVFLCHKIMLFYTSKNTSKLLDTSENIYPVFT